MYTQLTEQDKAFAEKCMETHKESMEDWPYGDGRYACMDTDGNLCIAYENGAWWHYRMNETGHIEWW